MTSAVLIKDVREESQRKEHFDKWLTSPFPKAKKGGLQSSSLE